MLAPSPPHQIKTEIDEAVLHRIHELIKADPLISRSQIGMQLNLPADVVRNHVCELENREWIRRDEPWS